MKTYLINTLQNISTINSTLDIVSTIKTSEWIIFNDDKSGIEKFLFIDNEKVLVSVNGRTSYLKWSYVKINKSLIIDDDSNRYLFKIIAYDKNIIVLNIDSTNSYSFLINSQCFLKDETYEEIQWYLIRKCGIDILSEEQRKIYFEEIKNEQNKRKLEDDERQLRCKRFIKKIIVAIGIILIAAVIGNCINYYIEYKMSHPKLYMTEKKNQKAIDLGLSVKWATCNIGANEPEECGNYYGWGEPTGTDVYGYNSENIDELNRRFPKREYGSLPPYSIINTSNDIAKYNWGGDWRMPTKEEVHELIEKCEMQYYNLNGKNLVKFIGPNGNFIVIPSCGFLEGTKGNWVLDNEDYSIYLYIGELNSPVSRYKYSENEAAYLFIGDTYDEKCYKIKTVKVGAIERYRMLPVRAVMEK